MTVLAVIPARGGSKGVPGKNIRLLGGRPLIAYSIETALKSPGIDRVVVSTDDAKTRSIALELGAEAPFLRPAEISGDKTADTPVLAHAAGWYAAQEGLTVEMIALFRPTTPFRRLSLVEACLTRLRESDADSVRSVRDMRHYHPYWMLRIDAEGFAQPFIPGSGLDEYHQRQMLPPVYRHDGYCDIIRTRNLPSPCPPDATLKGLYGKRMVTVLNDDPHFVNIDTEADFAAAERLLAENPTLLD